MNDENISKAVLEALKESKSKYKLNKDQVFPMAPSFIGETGRRAATLLGENLAAGEFIHVEILVTDTKQEIIEKVKKALKEKK